MFQVGASQNKQSRSSREDYVLTVANPARVKVGQAVTDGDIEEVDLSQVVGAFQDLTNAMQIAAHNPLDPRSQQAILRATGALQSIRQNPPRAAQAFVGAVIEPFAQTLQLMLPAVKAGLQVRVEQGERMLQQPTVPIPLNLNLAPGQSTSLIELKNPYLGSGAANYTQALWAITAIETPSNFVMGGCCTPGPNVLITNLTFAGHNYVQAGLNGITQWPNNQGRLAGTQGFPIGMFAMDKTYQRATRFRPWNLSGAEGIVGAVMRETGSVNIQILNANSQPCHECPFEDSIIVYCSASLCGLPWTADNLSRMYVPIALQAEAALSLASYQARMIGSHTMNQVTPDILRILEAHQSLAGANSNLLSMGNLDYLSRS